MKISKKPGRQKGVAVIELALILPVMLIVVFGITELGRALYQYNALVKATRDAVRYLAQQDLVNPPSGETASSIRAKTILVAVCGAPDCTDPTPRFPGQTLKEAQAKVSLCDYLSCANHKGVLTGQGTVDLVSVTIGGTGDQAFNFTSLIPYVVPNIAFAPIKTTMASRYF